MKMASKIKNVARLPVNRSHWSKNGRQVDALLDKVNWDNTSYLLSLYLKARNLVKLMITIVRKWGKWREPINIGEMREQWLC